MMEEPLFPLHSPGKLLTWRYDSFMGELITCDTLSEERHAEIFHGFLVPGFFPESKSNSEDMDMDALFTAELPREREYPEFFEWPAFVPHTPKEAPRMVIQPKNNMELSEFNKRRLEIKRKCAELMNLDREVDLFNSSVVGVWRERGRCLDAPEHDLLDFVESRHVMPDSDREALRCYRERLLSAKSTSEWPAMIAEWKSTSPRKAKRACVRRIVIDLTQDL